MGTAAAGAVAAPSISFTDILGGVTDAFSGIMKSNAASQQAEAQAAYQRQLAEQQAQQNYEQQVALRQEQMQEEEALNRKKLEAQITTRGVKSEALTAAAGAGVSGASVDALLSEYDIQSSMYLEGLERQKQLGEAYTDQNITNIGQNIYIPAPVESPSPMLGILGGVNSFLGVLGDTSSEDIKTSNLNRL